MITVIVYTLLWIVNIFNGTGLDYTYHVTDIAKYFVVVLFVMKLFRSKYIYVKKNEIVVYCGMVCIFLFVSYLNGYGLMGIKYLWVFCLVFLLSNLKIEEVTVKWIGMIFGILGIFMLLLYNYTSIFSGWNSNSIAMIGMHSFLVFLIPFVGCKSIIKKITFIFCVIVYAILMNNTVSRSSIIIIILGVLMTLEIIPIKIFIKTNFRLVLLLLLPLIVSILAVSISHSSIIETLNQWSLSTVNKTFFNGRDLIWQNGFDVIKDHLLFGTGNLNYYNWHNSAITCLVAYGVIGYLFWISTFKQLLINARDFIDDKIVKGIFMGFLLAYIQKSVELGMIGESPDILVFLILGMLCGRIKLKKKNKLDN